MGFFIDYEKGSVRTKRIATITLSVFVTLILLFTCIKVVDTGRVAVITQFGQVIGTEGAGIHIKAPWHRYNVIDVTQQQVTAQYATATKDNQSVNQEITAQIIISTEDVEDLYRSFLGNHTEGIVVPVLSDGFKSATAKYTLEETIEKRDQLSADMLKAVQERLSGYGIKVVSVEIKNVDLPEEYKVAVERQKVAERDKVTADVKRETAEIDANTNRILAESLSEENFQKYFYERWDGKLPLYMGGDGSLDMLLPSVGTSAHE